MRDLLQCTYPSWRTTVKLLGSEPRFVCFAPIDLKDSTIYLRDGFDNGAHQPTVNGAHSTSDTTLNITPGTMSTSVPAASVVRVTGQNTKYVIQSSTLNATGTDEVQTITASAATAGTFTITFNLKGQPAAVTTALAFDANAAAIQAAADVALAGQAVDGVAYVAGDVTVATATSADLTNVTLTYDGTSTAKKNHGIVVMDLTGLTGPTGGVASTTTPGAEAGSTTAVVISPGLSAGLSGGENLTFSGRELEVKLGEGNFTYDETREVEFIRDRGILSSYKEGDQQPLDVSFDFTWEFLGSILGATTPTIEEVLKQSGPAASWVSSNSADPCASYVVDVEIQNAPSCGSILPEVILIKQFFWTSLAHDSDAATVSVTGQCNVTTATLSRPTFDL